MPPSSVHFNGSVNLPDTETVMREISSRIPAGVRRMTDGETGERNYWILYQVQKLKAMPEFESVSSEVAYKTAEAAPAYTHLRLVPGASAETIQWPDLGYANEYGKSFEVFRRLQAEGTIPEGVRFQMQYPTPFASIARTIAPEDLPAVAPAYEAALFADLDRALSAIPHERCAVQWDVASEFRVLEGVHGPKASMEEIIPPLVRCVDHVPTDVPVGLHLCYGDYGHGHFTEPESLATQVQVANAIIEAAGRPVDFIAFTVPQNRADEAYFAPLEDLRAGSGTELYFGLVPYHPAEQQQGTTAKQVSLVDAHLPASNGSMRPWGISTECGMGRVADAELPRLLDLHREILASYGGRPTS